MITATEIGKRIKSSREKLNISPEAFCDDVKISRSALSMYENGNRIPRDEVKIRIARRLGMSIEAIFFAS